MSLRNFGKAGAVGVAGIFGEFRFLILTGALLFVPCLATLNFAQASNGCAAGGLCASSLTPWGVVTGIFLFDGPLNVTTFFLFAAMFFSMTMWESHDERKRRSLCLLVSSFVAATIANYIWMVVTPITVSGTYVVVPATYGQSGVVYGVIGSFAAGLLAPALPRGRSLSEVRAYFSSRKAVLVSLTGLAAILSVLIITVLSPNVIFGSALVFNVFVHKVSFFLSLGISLTYNLVARIRSQ